MNPREDSNLRASGGPMSGRSIIGETTEALHRFLLDGYNLSENPPRLEEELKFIPKDREEVVYIYMYRLGQNSNLANAKRFRQAPVFVNDDPEKGGEVYYHRPPIIVDLFYLISVHSKFRSDAERLLGWLMLRLNEATHMIYRPRRFLLPDGRAVDSLGRVWAADNMNSARLANGTAGADGELLEEDEDGLQVEKVSLAMVDDLTVGDAINLFTLHEAPYRPFLTYRARVALDGSLYKSHGGTTIRMGRIAPTDSRPDTTLSQQSPNGRVRAGRVLPSPTTAPGPKQYLVRKISDAESESEE